MATAEELKRLPLRAIVAYAARCARRVQPLYRLLGGVDDREVLEAAVSRAIGIAEVFANGNLVSAVDAQDAGNAAYAVGATATATSSDLIAVGAAAESAAYAAYAAGGFTLVSTVNTTESAVTH